MKQILLVSHCILNTAAKVVLYDEAEIQAEEALRIRFLQQAIGQGVQLLQLPCPEYTLYGARRWGHVREQFNNVFFRNHCKKILEPVLDQLQEYRENSAMVQVLGIVGVDGSPSCGVDYSCTGANSFGALGGRDDKIMDVIHATALCGGPGIFVKVLREELAARGMGDTPVVGLFAQEPEKCLALLGGH